jgi:hypothetical protein
MAADPYLGSKLHLLKLFWSDVIDTTAPVIGAPILYFNKVYGLFLLRNNIYFAPPSMPVPRKYGKTIL